MAVKERTHSGDFDELGLVDRVPQQHRHIVQEIWRPKVRGQGLGRCLSLPRLGAKFHCSLFF